MRALAANNQNEVADDVDDTCDEDEQERRLAVAKSTENCRQQIVGDDEENTAAADTNITCGQSDCFSRSLHEYRDGAGKENHRCEQADRKQCEYNRRAADDMVPASILWQIPVLSFLGALSSLIYPWDRSMTRKEFVIRIAIHYLIMNGIMLGGGNLFGWIDIHEPMQVTMMALSVAIIFFIISLYSWTKGNREAQKLNQRLKKRNDNES